MLEDVRLMILIVVIVGFGFLMIDGFRRRLKKKSPGKRRRRVLFGFCAESVASAAGFGILFHAFKLVIRVLHEAGQHVLKAARGTAAVGSEALRLWREIRRRTGGAIA